LSTDTPTARNTQVWRDGDFTAEYAIRTLRAVEVVLLLRYGGHLSGRTLEIGCGAGRLTGYLIELSAHVEGIDISAAMVDYCRRAFPSGHFRQGDLRDLSGFLDGANNAIIAPFNVLDILDDRERRDVLGHLHRMLAPGGLLIMSGHNRAHIPRLRPPTHVRTSDPLRLAVDLLRLPRRYRNSRRLRADQRNEPGYAIVNDDAHDFTLLHYYVTRDAQEAQLAAHGFSLVQCLDLDGAIVAPGEAAAGSSELHYVARVE